MKRKPKAKPGSKAAARLLAKVRVPKEQRTPAQQRIVDELEKIIEHGDQVKTLTYKRKREKK